MIHCRAVIFDMDGVIINSEPRHKQAFLEVCEDIGYGATHGFRFEDYVGRTDSDLWLDFVRKHNPPQSFDELRDLKKARIIEWIRREKPLFEGLLDLVNDLYGRYKLGLASGSERMVVDEVLQIDNLGKYFQASVSETEVPKGKPDPGIFLRTAALLEVAPEECCVIEDSKPGVAAGLAAGMRVIAITNTHPIEDLDRATHVVKTYREIRALLKA